MSLKKQERKKMKVALIEQNIIDEIRENQYLILSNLKNSKKYKDGYEKYISREKVAQIFDCDKQTIANLEKEGLIKRYGRGRLIRYSLQELKQALGIER